MSDETTDGLRGRLARSGEDALGRLAQDLLENPLVTGAIARALDAREKAAQAQELAMGALNLPSAADVERLTRRLRSVSQRLEGIEDAVDRLDGRLAAIDSKLGQRPKAAPAARGAAKGDDRLGAIEAQLATISKELGALHAAVASAPQPYPREQERLNVDEAGS